MPSLRHEMWVGQWRWWVEEREWSCGGLVSERERRAVELVSREKRWVRRERGERVEEEEEREVAVVVAIGEAKGGRDFGRNGRSRWCLQ